MKNANIPIAAANLSLRTHTLFEFTPEDWHELWMKQHRLSGCTTDPSMENDRTGTHIVGWNAKGPTAAQLKDFEEIKAQLMQLYRLLRQRLLKGEIACTPTEGACQFCDFGSICRYSGQLYKRNITSEELKKEREVHAEMEPGTTGSD